MSTLEYLSENRAPVFAGIAAILLASVLAYVLLHSSRPEAIKPPPTVTVVVIQPPKPPPPPPPVPQQKTIVQPKMTTPTPKPVVPNQPPKATPPKAAPAPAALGTSLKANGSSNNFDLAGNGNGNGCLGCTGTGGDGSGNYEAAAESAIRDALQKDPTTRDATAGLAVWIWTNASGLITGVELQNSSGNKKVDDAVQNQVLLDLQLSPPPPGTKMPILMRLTGQEPLQ